VKHIIFPTQVAKLSEAVKAAEAQQQLSSSRERELVAKIEQLSAQLLQRESQMVTFKSDLEAADEKAEETGNKLSASSERELELRSTLVDLGESMAALKAEAKAGLTHDRQILVFFLDLLLWVEIIEIGVLPRWTYR
jgi:uncharacterized coiled-coil DUF342 family protein